MFSFRSFFLLPHLSCCALKEKGYFSLSIEQCEGIKLAVKGATREFRTNEECFHGMPIIHLLFLLHLQVALNGFHALDLPDLCYDPLLSLFVMYETRENNISICRGNIDLQILGVRALDDYHIRLRSTVYRM